MTRLKLFAKLSLLMLSAKVLLAASPVQAFTLNIPKTVTSSSGYYEEFNNIKVTDDFGVPALLSFRIAAAVGSDIYLAGGQFFGGAVINITDLSITATDGDLTFANTSLLTVAGDFQYDFAVNVLAQQVLGGSFSGPNPVDPFTTYVVSEFGVDTPINIAIDSGFPDSSTTTSFRQTNSVDYTNSRNFIDNPRLSVNMSQLFLKKGETLFLPSSNCNVVVNSPSGLTLSEQTDKEGYPDTVGTAAEAACKGITPPKRDVPEPSAIAPLALLGMFGTAALWKRKQKLQ